MKIARLHAYPVKSCTGIALGMERLKITGFEWDRKFVLVDKDGKFLSQRTHPRMCLIKTDMGDDPEGHLGDTAVLLEAPNMPRHIVPMSRTESLKSDRRGIAFRECEITIHKDTCSGIDVGDEHAKWFSDFLGVTCRLIQQVKRTPRHRTSSAAGPIEVSFADGYPLLVVSEASLVNLNQRIAETGGAVLPMNRFRPNIVVYGCDAYAEDEPRRYRVGKATIRIVKPCVRCVITTIDQETAECGKEPLATLATYRKTPQGVIFGMNAIVETPGEVMAGDELAPL
jgi:uncharacterized protein YcbX